MSSPFPSSLLKVRDHALYTTSPLSCSLAETLQSSQQYHHSRISSTALLAIWFDLRQTCKGILISEPLSCGQNTRVLSAVLQVKNSALYLSIPALLLQFSLRNKNACHCRCIVGRMSNPRNIWSRNIWTFVAKVQRNEKVSHYFSDSEKYDPAPMRCFCVWRTSRFCFDVMQCFVCVHGILFTDVAVLELSFVGWLNLTLNSNISFSCSIHRWCSWSQFLGSRPTCGIDHKLMVHYHNFQYSLRLSSNYDYLWPYDYLSIHKAPLPLGQYSYFLLADGHRCK